MRKVYAYTVTLLLLLSACSFQHSSQAIPTDEVAPVTPTRTLEVDDPALTEEEIASLESLELVDAYPLFTMQYHGDYSLVDPVMGSPSPGEITYNWACALFATLADSDNHLFGRNFDWEYSPAVLLYTNPPDRYASVSMVDIAYLGFGDSSAKNLEELPASEKLSLLNAPYLPFDGMNEHGLAVGMAAVPATDQPENPDSETIDSLMVIRLILDFARDVDEALEIFEQYNLDWGQGPPLHYLVADSTGRSILVEFYGGEMIVFESQGTWQGATNFLQSVHGEDAPGVCNRYDTIVDQMESSGGQLLANDALDLLEDISQMSTQWSIVYGMSDGQIRIVMGREYHQVNNLFLEMVSGE